jgi:hypothetical protein
MTTKGTPSDEDGAQDDKDSKKGTVEPSEEKDVKKDSEEDTSKNEDKSKTSDKGDNEELSEEEKQRRNADSKISKLTDTLSRQQLVIEKQIQKNPKLLYELYDEDKDLALTIAERNPDLVERAIASETESDKKGEEEGEEEPLTKKDLEKWEADRNKKEKDKSMKEGLKDRQVKAIGKFLKEHPEIGPGSELETKVFARFKIYAKPDSSPSDLTIILEDSLGLATQGSYEAGERDAALQGAANASASSSTGGKGSDPKTKPNLTDEQVEFCNKHGIDYAKFESWATKTTVSKK